MYKVVVWISCFRSQQVVTLPKLPQKCIVDVAVVPAAADTTPQKPAFVVVSSGVDLMPEESSPSVAFVAPLAENTGNQL